MDVFPGRVPGQRRPGKCVLGLVLLAHCQVGKGEQVVRQRARFPVHFDYSRERGQRLSVLAVAEKGAAVEGVVESFAGVASKRPRHTDQQSLRSDVTVLVHDSSAGDAVWKGRFVEWSPHVYGDTIVHLVSALANPEYHRSGLLLTE